MAGAIDYPISAPTIGDMYSRPYGVLSSYNFKDHQYPGAYQNDFEITISDYYSGMNQAIDLIADIIDQAAKNEENREQKLLNAYMNGLSPAIKQTKLYKGLQQLVLDKNYSQAFDVVEKAINQIYDFNLTFEQNRDKFAEINDLFLNKHFVRALADEFGKTNYTMNKAVFNEIDLNKTGEQILKDVLDNYKERVKEKSEQLTGKMAKDYIVFLDKIENLLKQIFIIGYGEDALSQPLKQLEENKKIKLKRKEYEKKGKDMNVPLNQLVFQYVYGLFNGMPNEITLGLNGAALTGSVKQNGQNIKGDSYTLFTATGEIEVNQDFQKTFDFEHITHKDELEAFLAQDNFKDQFIIIHSAKDESLARTFNSYSQKGSGIKFAEPAALSKRIDDIREFGTAGNVMESGLNDLIFALTNLEYDMICANEKEAVKQALGAICVNWMFDDFGDIIANVSLSNNTTKICIYYINGWYFSLSDILHKTAEKIRSKKKNDLVTVKLAVPRTSSYAIEVPEGIQRWEKTRENIMSQTKLGFELKVKNLFSAFYGSGLI